MKIVCFIISTILGLLVLGCSSSNTSFYSICEHGMPTAGLSGMLIVSGVQGLVCDGESPERSGAYRETTASGFEDCRLPFAQATVLGESEIRERFTHCRSANDTPGWMWVCIAAHRQIPEAQDQMGQYYFWGYQPVEQQYAQAYKWSLLAAQNRNVSDSAYLVMMRSQVTQQQIFDAEELARQWQPHESECDPVELDSDR